MRRSPQKSKWAAFFGALDEHDHGSAPKTWVAWAWLLMMPPGVVAVWFFLLRAR
jgi:hypothetical protein